MVLQRPKYADRNYGEYNGGKTQKKNKKQTNKNWEKLRL